jgi:hypothetical protein
VHVGIEDHIARGPIEVAVTLVLMDEGLDRDEAMHVIGIVLLGIIGDVVVEDRSRATPPPRPLGARPGLWMAAWAFHIFRTVP